MWWVQVLIGLAMLLVAGIFATVVHEVGHAIAARATGSSIRLVRIGIGRPIALFRIRSTSIRIAAGLGFGGATYIEGLPTRLEMFVILSAGVVANVVVGVALLALYQSAPRVVLVLGAVNVLGVCNLIPTKPRPPSRLGSDGWNLQRLLFHPKEYNETLDADRRLAELVNLVVSESGFVVGESALEDLSLVQTYFKSPPVTTPWTPLNKSVRTAYEMTLAAALAWNGEDVTPAIDHLHTRMQRWAFGSTQVRIRWLYLLALSKRKTDQHESFRLASELLSSTSDGDSLSKGELAGVASLLAWSPMVAEHPSDRSVAASEYWALRACELLEPDMRTRSIDLVGLVRIRQGRLVEAEDLLRQSLSAAESPGDEAHKRAALALALVKQGQFQEAGRLVEDCESKSAWIPLLPEVLRALSTKNPSTGEN